MTVPVFGVDTRTMAGSIAQPEALFVVTATKRDISNKKPYPRKVHAVEEEGEEEIHFPSEIGSDTNYWSAQIIVNGRTTRFKLDTGAALTVLSDDVQYARRC